MNPGKRARSLEESGSDRPSKKPTLSIANTTGRLSNRHLSVSSASSSRQPSEDWVQQTGGLTIDSPLYPVSDHNHSFTSHSEGNTGDIDMVMDSEESINGQGTLERPHLSPLRTTSYSLSKPELHLQQQLPSHHGVSNSPRHPYGTRYAERMNGATIPPLINVVPATPVGVQHSSQNRVDGSTSSSGLIYSLSQPSTPPPSDIAPMAISPVTTFAQLASPVAPKRRVVFGPRSNCEKCRAGERHFIHYE
ncbi:hypothetical protein CVT25_015738 [Psilocybe cyanescens]|uniref:Uncharacterized protein n=1 Tax=Psilocybe cyanescens TaxID=93625 RepID=A0A409WRS8_PSICY|nr:hypothetical protein CVT25_015738 [Psilocybe cyanescens]